MYVCNICSLVFRGCGLMRFLVMYAIVVYLMIAILCTGCNVLLPDRLGVGVSHGTMTGRGTSNKFFNNQPVPMEMDMIGDTESTNIWFEWDLPAWKDPRHEQSNAQLQWEQDMERYLEERVMIRAMNSANEEIH
jgi:hypothetical protein